MLEECIYMTIVYMLFMVESYVIKPWTDKFEPVRLRFILIQKL